MKNTDKEVSLISSNYTHYLLGYYVIDDENLRLKLALTLIVPEKVGISKEEAFKGVRNMLIDKFSDSSIQPPLTHEQYVMRERNKK